MRRGRAQAGLAPSKGGALCPLLLQTVGLPPSGNRKLKVKLLSRLRLFVTPRTVAHQASLSMGFSRQESWSGLPFSSLEDLPDPGTEPRSPALLYPLSHQEAPRNWENKFPAEAGAGPGRGTTDPHGGPQGLGQGSACVPGRRKENQRGDTPRPERCGRVLRTRAAWGQPPVSPAAGTGRPAD